MKRLLLNQRLRKRLCLHRKFLLTNPVKYYANSQAFSSFPIASFLVNKL